MEYNNHHSFWSKREYGKRFETHVLRSHPAMQHRIPIVDHNNLHAEIHQPKLISTTLARIALQFLDTQPYKNDNLMKYLDTMEYFDKLSRGVGALAVEAGYFAEHLDVQIPYLERRKP